MVKRVPVLLWALLFVFSSSSLLSFGQTDYFTNYQPLRSEGKIPSVFTQSTEEKIEIALEKDRPKLSEKDEEIFLENIHYNVDELLNSGLVLYGDPVTKYVNKVADKLLENEPKLKKQLDFYVLKSNVTNALSTDQGIIFVTLGLLAQVENEAQLAYVLSHEIVHFQESHVEESFREKLNTNRHGGSYDQRITHLSNHSKDQELEADKRGIELYHKAGYAKSELVGAFDVMMYSYLPFDEVKLDRDYYRTDLLYVPEFYFPKEINEILADEDYDDDKSSHPNIRKRKDAIMEDIGDYSAWGKAKYLVSKDEFVEARKLARFEGIRLDLFNKQYGDALYSIYLLEKDAPNNLYLSRCKAQAWSGLATFKLDGQFTKTVQKPSSVEGESHALHFMLRKFSKIQLLSVAMRQVQDAYLSFPEDKELNAVRDYMIRNLARYSKVSLKNYRVIDYNKALADFEQSKIDMAKQDSLDALGVSEEEAAVEEEELSKYDKIKKKRSEVSASSEEDEFDFRKFHLYALSDLVMDEDFKRKFRQAKDKVDEEEEEEDRLRSMSKKERRQEELRRAEEAFSEDGYILLEPNYAEYYYGNPSASGADEKEGIMLTAINESADKLGITIHDLSSSNAGSNNTASYNERALLMDYLRQRAEFEDSKMFPVDFSYMGDLNVNYGDSKLLFVYVNYKRTRVTRRTELGGIVIDIKSGKVELAKDYYFSQRPRKIVLKGFIYDLLSHLK